MLDMIKQVQLSLEYDASAFDACLMQCSNARIDLSSIPYNVRRVISGCSAYLHHILNQALDFKTSKLQMVSAQLAVA